MPQHHDSEAADLSRPARWVASAGALAFIGLIALGPLLTLMAPGFRTPAFVPWPELGAAGFGDGSWMRRLEDHLRERSPVTWHLRGTYTEALFPLGLYDPATVEVGRDGWLYLAASIRGDFDAVARARPRRVQYLRELRARCDALGVRLLAVVVPDKVRIHPEPLFANGELPPGKRELFDGILGELAEAGVPCVDGRAALLRAVAQQPGVLLYQKRDTHWSLAGAAVVAVATHERLEQLGWMAHAGPPRRLELAPPVETRPVPDLVPMLGLRAHSAAADALREPVSVTALRVDGALTTRPEDPSAAVFLCGASFFATHFAALLPARLQRAVDASAVHPGGGSLEGLLQTLERIERREVAPAIVVWELVERSYLVDDAWGAATPRSR